jgi:hypothetical protein
MSLTLSANFFDAYDVFDCTLIQAGILFKHILSVFRTQRISKLVFELSAATARSTVTLYCDNELKKVYKIPSMEVEMLQANFDTSAFPTCIKTGAEALSRLLNGFDAGIDDLNILALPSIYTTANRDTVRLRSYIEPSNRKVDRTLNTQLGLESDSDLLYEYYHNSDQPSDATFNFKDFKAMLGLCEALRGGISIYIQGVGQPAVLAPHVPGDSISLDFIAELVLATLAEPFPLNQNNNNPAAAVAGGGGDTTTGNANRQAMQGKQQQKKNDAHTPRNKNENNHHQQQREQQQQQQQQQQEMVNGGSTGGEKEDRKKKTQGGGQARSRFAREAVQNHDDNDDEGYRQHSGLDDDPELHVDSQEQQQQVMMTDDDEEEDDDGGGGSGGNDGDGMIMSTPPDEIADQGPPGMILDKSME